MMCESDDSDMIKQKRTREILKEPTVHTTKIKTEQLVNKYFYYYYSHLGTARTSCC